jgi:hypothetical protein
MKKLVLSLSILGILVACNNAPAPNPASNTSSSPAVTTTATANPTASPTVSSTPSPAPAPATLSGKWQSTEDPKSVVEFTPTGQYVEMYDGKEVSSYDFQFDPACGNTDEAVKNTPNKVGCFSVEEPRQLTQFIVLDYTATNLEISMIGGRGNTLRFKKM